VTRLVRDLEHNFRDAVERSLNFKLDGSVTSLAIVDHYLAQAREETRAPILALLAAGAGAYFGELVAATSAACGSATAAIPGTCGCC
jgi:hypothetical protein